MKTSSAASIGESVKDRYKPANFYNKSIHKEHWVEGLANIYLKKILKDPETSKKTKARVRDVLTKRTIEVIKNATTRTSKVDYVTTSMTVDYGKGKVTGTI